MAGRPAPKRAGRYALWAVVAMTAAAAGVGGALAAREVAQARSLLRSQRLGLVLRMTKPGEPADLIAMPGIDADGVEVRPGSQADVRTEVRSYGDVRVTVRFAPGCPGGLVSQVEGEPPAMAWPRGRGPDDAQSNLRRGSVVSITAGAWEERST